MTDLHVVSSGEGFAIAARDGTVLAGPFPTNAAAWRALDRMEGEPISKAENTTDWLVSRQLAGH